MNIYLIVFIVYFGIIIATSIMGSKKVESMEDFAVGGNKMGLLLGVGTSMATWLSVASVMGVPGNIYSRGVCVPLPDGLPVGSLQQQLCRWLRTRSGDRLYLAVHSRN